MKTAKKIKRKAKPALGRKRDDSLDEIIIETTINILADVGFDRMTMDMVAAKSRTGKTSVYRRWPSKPELVRDTLIWMGGKSTETSQLPDTGSLRNDLISLVKYSLEHSETKMRVITKLGSFMTEHKKLYEDAVRRIFEPWTNANRALMKRAIDRGELPVHADIDMACDVIVSMTNHRTIMQNKHADKAFYSELLDRIILPALKNPNHP